MSLVRAQRAILTADADLVQVVGQARHLLVGREHIRHGHRGVDRARELVQRRDDRGWQARHGL